MNDVLHSSSGLRPVIPAFSGNYLGQVGFGSFAALTPSIPQSTNQDTSARLYLGVEVGEACQLACKHCIYHRPKSKSPKPNALVRDRVKEAFSRGFDPLWVSFAGKEPTAFPKQLIDLAETTRRTNRLNILMTNGLCLQGALLEDVESLFDYVDVSVDGNRAAHNWMRGPGTFERTWANLEQVVANSKVKVGIIATAVNALTCEGRVQIADIVGLAAHLAARFGMSDSISLSISLYYGPPGDRLLLHANQVIRLIEGLSTIQFRSRILLTSNYSYQWPAIKRRFDLDAADIRLDDKTRLPLATVGNTAIVLFNLSDASQIAVRVSNDGLTYLGCNHLVLGDEAHRFAVDDLAECSLEDSSERMLFLDHPVIAPLRRPPKACTSCSDWEDCRGGDRLSGIYFRERPEDPRCERLPGSEFSHA